MTRRDFRPILARSRLRPAALTVAGLLILVGGATSIYANHTTSTKTNLARSNSQGTTGSTDLISGQHWQMAGVTVLAASQQSGSSLEVASTDLAIVKHDGSFGQSNSPVNLYGTRLQVSGNFSVSAKVSGASKEIGLSLYGTPSLIEDELRAEEGTLDIKLNGSSLGVSITDQQSGLLAAKEDVKVAADANPTITITDRSGQLTFKLNNRVVGKPLDDHAIFQSGKIWLGVDARTPGSKFTVDKLTAMGQDGGIVSIVDARNQKIELNPGGFAALAQKQRKDFLIGTAVALGPMVADPEYRSLLGNYNSVTTENAGKFQTIHPHPGDQPQDYNFAEMDGIVAMAHKASIQVHGHALVFGEANPIWVQEIAKNHPSELEQVMVDHIKTVVSHYKGQVASWDVINEPLDDYSTQPGQYGGLRENIWYNAIGPNYIAIALRAAHQADPNVKLWINDFGMESDDKRFTTMLSLLERLKAQRVPLTGVGFQAHIDSGDTNSNDTHIDASKLRSRIVALQQLGIKARISELDVANDSEYAVFSNVIYSCIQEPNCEGVTMWGVTDKYSSSGDFSANGIYTPGIGLPWDFNLQPLPAVAAIKKMLEK